MMGGVGAPPVSIVNIRYAAAMRVGRHCKPILRYKIGTMFPVYTPSGSLT